MHPSLPRSLQRTLLACTLILACDSPTKPGDPTGLSFGRAVTGHVVAADSQSYHIDVKAGQMFAVYVQSPGTVALVLRDPSRQVAGGVLSTPGDTATLRDGVIVRLATEGRYTMTVTSRIGTDADFTLRAELVDLRPEHAPQPVTLGSVVTGERIDAGFDQDEFLFDIPAGTEVELYVHADELPQAPDIHLDPWFGPADLSSTLYLQRLNPTPATADFQQLATGKLTLGAGKYALRMSGTYGVAYSFQLRPIDKKPESASATLAGGDTISESIDYVGDVDDFLLRGTPGEVYEVFVAASGTSPHSPHVGFPELDGGHGTYAVIDQPLLDAATGGVVMPASGQLTVRVADASDHDGLYRGPYRLAAVAIDRHPEGQNDVIVPSTSVLAGTFEVFGDVDEYRFTLDKPTPVALRCAPTPLAGCIAFGAAVYNDAAPATPVTLGASALPAGNYRLHLESRPGFGGPATAAGMYRGPYQVVLAAKESAPEDAATALVVGTPVTESLTWPWDDDTFTFDVATADTILMHLTMTDALSGTYRLDLRDAATGADVAPTGQYGELPTEKRWPLAAGRYAVTLSWTSAPWLPGKRGSYAFELDRVSAAPEGRSAEVAVGDTVSGNFDVPGDIDDYVLRGAPGEMFSLHLFTVVPSSDYAWSSITVRDSATGDMITNPWRTIAPLITAPLTIPGDGVLRLRVCPELACLNYVGGSPYKFSIDHVDPAPESRGAQFALGDTVADAIEHPADVDDFTFDAIAGQVIDLVVLQAPGDFPAPDGLLLYLIDGASGAQLATLPLDSGAAASGTNALRGVVLPHAGPYRVRIQTDPALTDRTTTGPYRFLLTGK